MEFELDISVMNYFNSIIYGEIWVYITYVHWSQCIVMGICTSYTKWSLMVTVISTLDKKVDHSPQNIGNTQPDILKINLYVASKQHSTHWQQISKLIFKFDTWYKRAENLLN